MNPLPWYVETWTVTRTQEKHYLCRLCAGADYDHGTEESFRIHLSSWSHKIRVRKMDTLFCKVCSIQFRYPSHYNAHLKSKAHKFKETPSLKPIMSCESCNVQFGSYKEQSRHLATKKHAKNAVKPETSNSIVKDTFDCKVCSLQFRYPSHYKAHLESKAHKFKENPTPKEKIEYACECCNVKFESEEDITNSI